MSETHRTVGDAHGSKRSEEVTRREPERGQNAGPITERAQNVEPPRTQEDLNEIKIVQSIEEYNIASQKNSDKSIINETYKTSNFKLNLDHDHLTQSEHASVDSLTQRSIRMSDEKGKDSFIERFLILISYMFVVMCFPVSLFCVFVVVRQFERAVILRNGKVHKNRAFGPGLIHYMPCVDIVKFTDLRVICYAVPPQEALTKDSLTVSVDAVVYYKICNPVWAVLNVADYRGSTQFLAATTLRNALGTKKLSDILTDRKSVCCHIFRLMKRFAKVWGIKIVRVEIKDICLPLQLQKAMAAEAESSRLANAKIIVAKAEIETTKNLQQATTLLMDNPLCMQLRYLQSLHMIASDKTHTIVFPFSIEAFKKIFK